MDNTGSRNIQGKVPEGIDGLRSSALHIAYISITDLSQTKRMMENTKAGVTPCLGMNKIKNFHFSEILAKIRKFSQNVFGSRGKVKKGGFVVLKVLFMFKWVTKALTTLDLFFWKKHRKKQLNANLNFFYKGPPLPHPFPTLVISYWPVSSFINYKNNKGIGGLRRLGQA